MTLPGVTAERMQAAIVQVTEQVPAEVDGGWEVPAESNAVIRFEPPSDNGLLRVAVVSPVKIAQKDYPTVLMVFNEFNMKSTDATLYMTKVPRGTSWNVSADSFIMTADGLDEGQLIAAMRGAVDSLTKVVKMSPKTSAAWARKAD
ncbi:Hypothetical protein PFCIRM134_02500 [Propionibacterium freudenreichii]|uniref:YbjN domain-containing protein n=1 Tax=Propionibacterium freudenreichii TaxID=1744 RepID=A0A2C8BGP4_9ACTN|nr:Hypothetical protein CB129slpB_2068 [Propionibacterium freudenreichii]CDP49468.1 Hypothetical protein PFCIRM129_12085 [Propionibacterium freudenreichii subsp. freudenreichii]CEG86348.1 Hypothetical protein PFCIRM118_09985 [Propionibacterium freudenreichii]CEH05893.1 Hypothetical protein PFCIRM134_02500 [Propionibacterium freudenreichii]CEH08342.1 Hypothetical protein PFCIRM135_11495 [Propionibacterium freudenreichii]